MNAGNLEAARDLFAAALQLKLAGVFLAAVHAGPRGADDALAALKGGDLAAADRHVAQAESYIRKKNQKKNNRLNSMVSAASSSATSTTASETSSSTESEAEGSSTENEKQPYLYDHAFQVQGDGSNLISGALFVFNMGLVYHLQDKSCTKVSPVGILLLLL